MKTCTGMNESGIHIVGHGLAGCVLAMTCYRRKIPFSMSGVSRPGEASVASSGLIAPVTGRRYVKAWMIDELLESACDFYDWTRRLLGTSYFTPVEIIRFLKNDEAIIAWRKRQKDPAYRAYISDKRFWQLDILDKPYGILTGGYRLDTPGWLEASRHFLAEEGKLIITEEKLDSKHIPDRIVVLATGAMDQVFSKGIIPNKGEALVVRLPDWRWPGIVKEEIFIVPLTTKGTYWAGSYYEHWPEDPYPSETGRNAILEAVRTIYTGRIDVIDHVAGVRPTVDDRRPLVGALPDQPGYFVFNGMGTKGTSLAPYWAGALLDHITSDVPLPTEVSPARYYP